MELDSLTLESPELQEFVNSAIAIKTKGLQSQVSKLNNQLNAKNQNKGAKKPGAQPQKQKGKKNQTAQKHLGWMPPLTTKKSPQPPKVPQTPRRRVGSQDEHHSQKRKVPPATPNQPSD
jgi:hypothetical protein